MDEAEVPQPVGQECVGDQGDGGGGDDAASDQAQLPSRLLRHRTPRPERQGQRGAEKNEDVQDVGQEERPVDGDVLARADEFLPVDQRGQEGERPQQGRLRPQPVNRMHHRATHDVAHEEEAEGDGGHDAGEVEPPEPEEDAAGGQEVEGEEACDPAEQGEGEEGEMAVEAGAGVSGEDEKGEAGEEEDAEDVERGEERGHGGKLG